MRVHKSLLALTLSLIWACASPTSPSPSVCLNGDAPLTGTWHPGPNPGGGGIFLDLCQVGQVVTGTSWIQGPGIAVVVDSGPVSGTLGGSTFVLVIDYGSGKRPTYTGQLADSATIQGTWTWPSDTGVVLTFIR